MPYEFCKRAAGQDFTVLEYIVKHDGRMAILFPQLEDLMKKGRVGAQAFNDTIKNKSGLREYIPQEVVDAFRRDAAFVPPLMVGRFTPFTLYGIMLPHIIAPDQLRIESVESRVSILESRVSILATSQNEESKEGGGDYPEDESGSFLGSVDNDGARTNDCVSEEADKGPDTTAEDEFALITSEGSKVEARSQHGIEGTVTDADEAAVDTLSEAFQAPSIAGIERCPDPALLASIGSGIQLQHYSAVIVTKYVRGYLARKMMAHAMHRAKFTTIAEEMVSSAVINKSIFDDDGLGAVLEVELSRFDTMGDKPAQRSSAQDNINIIDLTNLSDADDHDSLTFSLSTIQGDNGSGDELTLKDPFLASTAASREDQDQAKKEVEEVAKKKDAVVAGVEKKKEAVVAVESAVKVDTKELSVQPAQEPAKKPPIVEATPPKVETPKQQTVEEPTTEDEIVSQLKASLASKEEEVQLCKKRIESLTATIQNSARKLIPSAIAANDKVIYELNRTLNESQLETSVANERIVALDKELKMALDAKSDIVRSKDEEASAKIALLKEGHAKAIATKEDDILVEKEVCKTMVANAKEKHACALASLNEKLSSKEEHIAKKDTSISSLTSKVLALQKENETIAIQTTEISSLKMKLAERNAEANARDDEILNNRACIMSLEAELKVAMGKLENMDNPVKCLQEYLAMKDKLISLLEASLVGEDGNKEEEEEVATKEEESATKKKKSMKKEEEVVVKKKKEIVKKKKAGTVVDAASADEEVEEKEMAKNEGTVVVRDEETKQEEAEVDASTSAATTAKVVLKTMIKVEEKRVVQAVVDDARDDTEEVLQVEKDAVVSAE